MTPDQALLRLRRLGLPGLVLLESGGPLTPHSRFSFLSAAPTRVIHTLPERPDGQGHFPAWLGGLKYEAAAEFGLPVQRADGPSQTWGFYPSGLVWDRAGETLSLVGEPHLDWQAVLEAAPADLAPLSVSPWSPEDLDYPAGVRAVQELIRAGETYQVNLSRGVRALAAGDPLAAYLRLRALNPSPFMAYAELDDEVVMSVSPERLVAWEGETLNARPIAGTRRRGGTPAEDAALEAELRATPKERAEHVMLLDLIRHDLGRAADSASVWVPEALLVERYSHVMHLVSEVAARAAPGLTLPGLLAATFPGGTITGAPKRRVMQAIRDLEAGPRGWYTGSIGIVNGQRADLNILIRTAAFRRVGEGWAVEVRAGAGVVIDSDPDAEAQEAVIKAGALLEALSCAPSGAARPPAPATPGEPWSPPPAPARLNARVLLLDNFDSFTFNLLHDLQALGAEVLVRENSEALESLLALQPSHVLIGPGPGTPASSGVTLDLARACLEGSLPLLGVCLGHQALGELLGARLVRAAPVHGRPEAVRHDGAGLFAGLPPGAAFGRYHSLALSDLPSGLRATAHGEDGVLMALEVPGRPAWGVQFHPESVLSPHGRHLLANWLRLGVAWNGQR